MIHTVYHIGPPRTLVPTKTNNRKLKWNGSCLEIGAQQIFINSTQAKAYFRLTGTKFKPRFTPIQLRFGNDTQESLGTMNLSVPIDNGYIIHEKIGIFKDHVLFLFGLDVLDKYQMLIKNVNNTLISPNYDLNTPLQDKGSHIYLEWDN